MTRCESILRSLRVWSQDAESGLAGSLPMRASALGADDSKQLSRLLNTFEFVHAAIFEAKASAGDEVAHGCRYEDLTRAGKGGNPCSCVH